MLILEYIKNTSRKKMAIVISLLTLAIALPLFILISLQQQDLRQRAAQGDTYLELDPSSITKSPNENFTVNLRLINPNAKDIVSVIAQLNYDNLYLEVTDLTVVSDFVDYDSSYNNQQGKIKIDILNGNPNKTIDGNPINLAAITFHTKSQTGTTNVAYGDIDIREAGETSPLTLTNNKVGTYTIQQTPNPSPSPTTAPLVIGPHRRVFVTSETYTGNLGGLTGGDAKCQALAEGANLGGTWMAWLSDSVNSPSTREEFVKSDIPYALVDRTLIATNWGDLTDRSLQHPINKTQTGTQLPETRVHTGTTGQGISSIEATGTNYTCNNWTSATTNYGGAIGITTEYGPSGTWSWLGSSSNEFCDKSYALYCFEQTVFIPPTSTPTAIQPTPTPITEEPVPSLTPTPTTPDTSNPTSTPTPTQEPAPTINPNSTILTLPSLALEGFESGNPKDKDIIVYLYPPGNDPKNDIDGKKLTTKQKVESKIKHSNGKYSLASLDLGELPNGTKILIKIRKYLRVLVATQADNKNISAALTKDKFIIGDVEENNRIDIVDYNAIRNCFGSKLNTEACAFKETVDLNEDGNVDGLDYNLFLKSLSFTARQGD